MALAMGKTVVVVDSTADLPESIRDELGIHMVPLNVHFGLEIYKDQIDLDSNSFYQKLKTLPILPKTSQPSPGSFLDVYKQVATPEDLIISYHISGKVSGTIQSALMAKSLLPDYNIKIIDSEGLSLHYGMQAIEIARKALHGASFEEIKKHLEKVKQSIQVCFTVETLEYLYKGGRLSRGSAIAGGLLDIKPIIKVDEKGALVAVEKVRGREKSIRRLIEIVGEKGADLESQTLGLIHGDDKATLDRVKEELIQRYGCRNFLENYVGCAIGAHTGPGIIGITFLNSDSPYKEFLQEGL